MPVNKKGRLLYQSIFCPDYLFFYHTESSVTNSLLWWPLANFFIVKLPDWLSDKQQQEQAFPELHVQGPGPELRLSGEIGSTPALKDPIKDRAKQPKQWDYKTYRWSAKGNHAGQDWAAGSSRPAHCPEAWTSACPMTTKRTSHRAAL